MIELAIKNKLLARTQLTAIVSNRIYYPHLPQSVAYPCINFFLVSGPMHNDVDIAYPRYQFDAFAATYAKTIEIISEIKKALNKESGIWDGYNIIGIYFLNELDVEEPANSALFHRIVDFKVTYKD